MSEFSHSVVLSGKEVNFIVEGGKGISATKGESSGLWAYHADAIGTFSGVNADSYDDNGNIISQIYKGKTRKERHEELICYSIEGAVSQAKIAHETASGRGRLHMNVLWEMGGAEQILQGVLSRSKGLIDGITCGAGMPYKLSQIASQHKVYYYPIVSSARAFRALWKRAYHKCSEWLGAVVYEDPWRAGGHNGLSNAEDPLSPEDPYHRVRAIREMLNQFKLNHVPIIMAGGVWCIKEFKDWIDNIEIGPIAFQFGTRPLLTKESPIPQIWKDLLLRLKPGDVKLQTYSPTGFYSSAVNNKFLQELEERSARQISYKLSVENDYQESLAFGNRNRNIFVRREDIQKIQNWKEQGYTQMLKTPDKTVIFVNAEKESEILADQRGCMGCLSACKFSNWRDKTPFKIEQRPDPRSFCIQKTLQEVAHSEENFEKQLVFAGHNAFRFAHDPLYKNGYIPSIKELVREILKGD